MPSSVLRCDQKPGTAPARHESAEQKPEGLAFYSWVGIRKSLLEMYSSQQACGSLATFPQKP